MITDYYEIVVRYESGPDKLGRRHFTAFWLDDNIGYACNEHGVRVQCFHADPTEFVTRAKQRGRRIRIEDSSAC
jgi:hypothetical protein